MLGLLRISLKRKLIKQRCESSHPLSTADHTGLVVDPGTDAEKRYREWYEVRYHRPQDDITQPMDFLAAAKFDVFFYRLVETVADTPVRPSVFPTSQFAVKK